MVCFAVQARAILRKWAKPVRGLFSKHLALSLILYRYQNLGPWSRLSFLVHVAYIAVNSTVVLFRPHSLTEAGRRAGELALVNLIYPLAATHLACLADHLGVSWQTCCQIHRTTGWMSIALLSFHIIVEVLHEHFMFPVSHKRNLFTLIVCLAPVDVRTKLTSIGCRISRNSCAAFSQPRPSMVVRSLSSWPSIIGRGLRLRDLATSFYHRHTTENLSLHRLGDPSSQYGSRSSQLSLPEWTFQRPRCAAGSCFSFSRSLFTL